jgi:hypothetical protein
LECLSSPKIILFDILLNKDELAGLNLTKPNIPNMFSDHEKNIEIRNKSGRGEGADSVLCSLGSILYNTPTHTEGKIRERLDLTINAIILNGTEWDTIGKT